MAEENADLRQQLARNSGNSSKPPSSDAVTAQPAWQVRQAKRRPGWPPGQHPEQDANTRGRKARRPGHNLLVRQRDNRDDVLRCLADFAVPFSNNQAEQDLRMMKLRVKISGTFRTLEGAQAFADIRSVISTARKHGLNILEIHSKS